MRTPIAATRLTTKEARPPKAAANGTVLTSRMWNDLVRAVLETQRKQ